MQNIHLIFITLSSFSVSKNITLLYFESLPPKKDLQQTTVNHLSDINFKDFMKLYKRCAANNCFLVNDIILVSDNPLRFRSNVLENN